MRSAPKPTQCACAHRGRAPVRAAGSDGMNGSGAVGRVPVARTIARSAVANGACLIISDLPVPRATDSGSRYAKMLTMLSNDLPPLLLVKSAQPQSAGLHLDAHVRTKTNLGSSADTLTELV